ncbi:MAG: precorrin-6Y C5,15-methyltransferase (decarboxylating) subunit CbiT, partial [Campylobacterales bacterium]|nr:precorrin-6Y C5,15-methyltransferase (decarboxylating) subunit CbiT [Campylobacterales bacterium]
YKLGFKEEKIEEIDLFSCEEFENPYVLLIKKEFQAHKKISEDEEFEKDRGMITKSYKRHLALQFLDLEPNQTLWDIGAGSGSVGIDGYKRYKIQTVFFEKNEKRCEDIEKNLSKHKVLDTKLYRGNAIGNFEKEEKNPDRIFIGGGADEVLKKLPYLYERLAEKGVIVINLVTLKTLTIALKTLEENQIEFQVQSLSLTNYKTNLLLGENSRELFIVKINK